MGANRHPFRKTKLRTHHFPSLYFDADFVKPLKGDRLFSESTTKEWDKACKGMKALRHPIPANQSDPLYLMMLVDMLMKIEVHADITSRGLTDLLNSYYRDIHWDVRQVGRMMRTIYDCQSKTSAPTFGTWKALNSFRGDAEYHYSLWPDRETYVWLARVRMNLETSTRTLIRKERRLGLRAIFGNDFNTRFINDPKDPNDHSDEKITEGIVYRQK